MEAISYLSNAIIIAPNKTCLIYEEQQKIFKPIQILIWKTFSERF